MLQEAGFRFRVHSVKVSENIEENLNPRVLAQDLARRKAKAALETSNPLELKGFLILSADTIVVMEQRVLGKPENFEQAREFLELLSGKMHSVITGFCLIPGDDPAQTVTNFDETFVEFRTLSAKEIDAYLKTGESMDKAGAYAIQGKGKALVQRYQGSWSNVVGLPVEKLKKELDTHGWSVYQRQPG